MSIKSRTFALVGIMALTGCPYTEGCEALTEPGAAAGDAGAADGAQDGDPGKTPDGGLVDADLDSGFPQAGSIDFGAEPTGGPTLSALTCPALSMPAKEATVYVDANAVGAEAGTKAAPFRTVAQAFASAAPQAIVWVAAGTYRENVIIPDKAILVLGGFARGFGARTDACATILEAADASQAVLSASADVRSFTMEGLSVRKGARGITVAGDNAAPPTFTIGRCVFSENGLKSDVAGAVALDSVNARVFRNVFRDNRASKGAAVAASGEVTLTIDQNLFDRNLGYADHGGGLYLSTKATKISRNTFRGNRTGVTNRDGWGGALIIYSNSPASPAKADLAFNVFTENVAAIGGAVFVDDGSVVTMSHDLLYRNRGYPESGFLRGPAIYVDGTGLGPSGASTLTAEYLTSANNLYDDNGNLGTPTFGGNAYIEGFSKATFTNSIFWNNGPDAFYVLPQTEISVSNSVGATACTSSDAMGFIPAPATACRIGAGVFLPGAIQFVNEAAYDFHEKSTAGHYANGSWVLDAVTSPAIDKGDPLAAVGLEPAPNGGRANLGAFAGTKEASKSP